MKKNWIGLVCAVLALSACGKSLRVTQKPAGLNNSGGGSGQNIKQEEKPIGNLPTQKLIAISLADSKEIKDKKLGLPFVSGEENVDFRTIESPTGRTSSGAGFVKSNNVVFRALIHVPKADQIEKVSSLTLTLQNWSLVTAKDGTAPENTVLCLIGGENTKKSCFGKVKLDAAPEKSDAAEGAEALTEDAQPEASSPEAESANPDGSTPIEIKAAKVNPEFFKDLKIADGVETKMEDAGEIAATQEKIKVAKTTEIDLLKTFGIKPEDALKWITDNSVDFDGKGTRKVRLVMGDQLYAASGSLVLNAVVKGAAVEESVGTPVVQDDEKAIAAIPAATLKGATPPAEEKPAIAEAATADAVVSGKTPVGSTAYNNKRKARITAIGAAIQEVKTKHPELTIESVQVTGTVQKDEGKVKTEFDNALKDLPKTVTITKSSDPSAATVTVKLKGPADKVSAAKTELETALTAAFAKNS